MSHYIIVQGKSLEELAKHVNEALHNGYHPTGAITKTAGMGQYTYGSDAQYIQPMVKP